MKDEILGRVSMQQVLDRYGIKNNGKMFCCPFHGEDRHPSAKIYENSFYCFCCNKADTTIGFTMDLFNLSFKEAMQKINIDFGLGLDPHTPVDYEKLNQIKQAEFEKKKIKEKQIKKYSQLCDIRHCYQKLIKHCTKQINIKNWEKLTHAIAYFQERLFMIDNQLEILDEKLSTRN